jgi:hypothetical protein
MSPAGRQIGTRVTRQGRSFRVNILTLQPGSGVFLLIIWMTDDSKHKDHEACTKRQLTIFNAILGLAYRTTVRLVAISRSLLHLTEPFPVL